MKNEFFEELNLLDDPFEQFKLWFEEAMSDTTIVNPNAMCLSTIDNNRPDSRMLLFKGLYNNGFTFYTNLFSRKANQLKQNPMCSLNFHWDSLRKQIRILGKSELLPSDIADDYFASRPRESQIGAYASKQSSEITSINELIDRFDKYNKKFQNQNIPRPSFWSGYVVYPIRFEFWIHREHRLHDRIEYQNVNGKWIKRRLFP